jgi:hypothetical protein
MSAGQLSSGQVLACQVSTDLLILGMAGRLLAGQVSADLT